MSLVEFMDSLKNSLDDLPLHTSGDEIEVVGAYGVLHYSGETPLNRCTDPNGFRLWQIVITACNLQDVLQYWCVLQNKLLRVSAEYGIYDIQPLMSVPYLVKDDEYEMIIKFKTRI